MANRSLAAALLSLSTSRERAEEIEGDLIEERERHGTLWFAVHVVGTALALFAESIKDAPWRIALLGAASASIWIVACGLFDRAFFAQDALVPAPFLGLLATLVSAFLTGFGLGSLAPNLGVRAAVFTAMLLVALFFVTRASAGAAQFIAGLDVGIGIAILNACLALLLSLSALVLSVVVFLVPLITGSVYAHNRATSTLTGWSQERFDRLLRLTA